MPRKDILAAGGRRATFAGGMGEGDILRNVAPEGTRDEFVPEVAKEDTPRKKFIPTEGVVLVRRAEPKSPSGILITETIEKDAPAEGTVLEVGPNSLIVRGSHVVFGKYSGAEFKLNGELLLLMEEGEIKGFIVDEDTPAKRAMDDYLAKIERA